MVTQRTTNDNPWTIFISLCDYIKQGQERTSLKRYQLTIRTHRDALIESVCNNGFGNIAIFIGFLSGVCELASVFAFQLAPKLFTSHSNNPGWNSYTEISSIATVAFGLAILVLGKIFSHASSEKYKARRGLPSLYPHYRCSPRVNICCSLLFSIFLFSSSLYLLSINCESNWPICHSSVFISVLRFSSLLPPSIQMPTNIAHKERIIKLNVAQRLSIALFVPLVFGFAIFELNPRPSSPLSQFIAITLAVQFLLLMLWAAASGSTILSIWCQEHLRNLRHNKATEIKTEDLRTPKGWFFRNLPYNVAELICLFALLIIASIVPAPIFTSLELMPVFAP